MVVCVDLYAGRVNPLVVIPFTSTFHYYWKTPVLFLPEQRYQFDCNSSAFCS